MFGAKLKNKNTIQNLCKPLYTHFSTLYVHLTGKIYANKKKKYN